MKQVDPSGLMAAQQSIMTAATVGFLTVIKQPMKLPDHISILAMTGRIAAPALYLYTVGKFNMGSEQTVPEDNLLNWGRAAFEFDV